MRDAGAGDRHARASRRRRGRRPRTRPRGRRDARGRRRDDVAGARDALALADSTTASTRASASIRTRPASPATSPSCATLLAHPKAVAVGETGLDYFRDYAPHDAQQRLFDQQLALARELGKPVVIHTRAADDDTRARLVDHDGTVILHCFSSPPLLDDALAHGWYVSFAGNVTYKNAYDLRDCARRVPPTACSSRPTARTSRRRPSAAAETSRPTSPTPTTSSPSCAARTCARSRDANATRVFGLHEARRAQEPSASTSWSTRTSSA